MNIKKLISGGVKTAAGIATGNPELAISGGAEAVGGALEDKEQSSGERPPAASPALSQATTSTPPGIIQPPTFGPSSSASLEDARARRAARMARYGLVLLLVCLIFSRQSFAQSLYSGSSVRSFTTAEAGNTIRLIGSGIQFHKISWTVSGGTLGGCSVKLEQSADASSWSDLISGQTCTANNTSSIVNGVVNYVRINATTFTVGTGTPTLTVRWYGYVDLNNHNVRFCDQFNGANAGAKIAACIADLPNTGGTADALGLEGTQSITTDIFSGIGKRIILLLGGADYQISATQTISADISIIGFKREYTLTSATMPTTVLTWTGGASAMITASGDNFLLHDVGLANSGTGTVAIQNNAQYSDIRGVVAITPSGGAQWSSFTIAYASSLVGIRHRMSDSFFYNSASTADIEIPRGNVFYFDNVHVVFPESIGVRVGNTAAVTNLNWFGGAVETDATASGATATGIKVLQADTFSVSGTYFETELAGQHSIDLAPPLSDYVMAANIYGSRFQGNNAGEYAIALTGATNGTTGAQFNGNLFVNFANGAIRNSASAVRSVFLGVNTLSNTSALMSGLTGVSGFIGTAVAFADLGTPNNGTIAYCSDCTITNPCAGSGTGALAKRLNGAWVCN